jgi:hypothetical protein
MEYKIVLLEELYYTNTYWIEADSEEKALEAALSGSECPQKEECVEGTVKKIVSVNDRILDFDESDEILRNNELL